MTSTAAVTRGRQICVSSCCSCPESWRSGAFLWRDMRPPWRGGPLIFIGARHYGCRQAI